MPSYTVIATYYNSFERYSESFYAQSAGEAEEVAQIDTRMKHGEESEEEPLIIAGVLNDDTGTLVP